MAEHQAVEIAAWALGQLAIGEGGWVAFADDSVPEWVMSGTGRTATGGSSSASCTWPANSGSTRPRSALPLGRIEAQVNAFAGEIRPHLKDVPRPGVELQPPQPQPRWRSHEVINVVPALDVPAGRKPDGFYRRVAEVYAELALLSRRPAADMAEASGVSAASVPTAGSPRQGAAGICPGPSRGGEASGLDPAAGPQRQGRLLNPTVTPRLPPEAPKRTCAGVGDLKVARRLRRP